MCEKLKAHVNQRAVTTAAFAHVISNEWLQPLHSSTALCMCTSLTPYLYPFAAQVRLQPLYVYILGSSKGAVTTALHAHSTRTRLIGMKKDSFTFAQNNILIC